MRPARVHRASHGQISSEFAIFEVTRRRRMARSYERPVQVTTRESAPLNESHDTCVSLQGKAYVRAGWIDLYHLTTTVAHGESDKIWRESHGVPIDALTQKCARIAPNLCQTIPAPC